MGRWFRRLVTTRKGEERGAVLVLLSIAMVVMIGATALAVDVGQVTNNNRRLQAAADVIAMDAGRALTGGTAASLSGAAGGVVVAVQKSATRNNFSFSKLTVELGTLSGTTFTSIATAVSNGAIQTVNSNSVPKAVRITAAGTVNFAFVHGAKTTTRSAIAVQDSAAGFSIGSFLVGTTGAEDTVLSAIFGDSFHAQILSYSGLANANVSLKAIGLNMPVTALSPSQLLSTSVSAKDLMLASAAALNDGSHAAAVTALNALAASVTATTMINLGDTMQIATGGDAAAAAASVNVLQMLTAQAFLVDGTHAITIPQAQVNLAGLGSVTINLNVITPAKTVFGPVGTSASNTQVQLTVTPQIHISTAPSVNGCSLNGLLGSILSLNVGQLLTCTLGGVVGEIITLDLNASIPIDLSAAGASATLSAINCASPQSITLAPTLNPLTVNTNVDLAFTGTLLGQSLGNVLRVRASAGAVTQTTPASQVFLNPSQFGVARTVSSGPIGLAGLTNLTTTDVTLLNANVGPVLSALTTPVLSLLNSTLGSLDTALISPLNHLLGLAIGGADLTALSGSLSCNNLRLAG